jgi:hypothetical protein
MKVLQGLEAELAGLQPVRPSPFLAARVGPRLGRPPGRRSLFAVAALAASLLAVLAWPRPSGPSRPPVASGPLPAPTVAAYRGALAESIDALEALLDRQASRDAGGDGPFVSVGLSVTSPLPD